MYQSARRRGTGRPPGLDRSSNGPFLTWRAAVLAAAEPDKGPPLGAWLCGKTEHASIQHGAEGPGGLQVLFAVSSFWSTPVILSPEMREGSPHLFPETPKFLIGYYVEFSNDRDLKNRRRSSEIVKCVADLLIPFMYEPIGGKVTVVLVAAWIR